MTVPAAALLVTGILVIASIAASRISDRLGVPALIVFLGIGMLAGSEGLGGIEFDNAVLANFLGTVALAFILFSGGIDTHWNVIRPVLWRGALLSTFGVAVTAALVGLFAWAALGFGILTSLLLGAIVSSTDAAAVFSVLRGRGVGLKGNLKPLLELESGSNDPMAIFLTLGITQLLIDPEFEWPMLIPALLVNMAGGVAVGFGVGKLAGCLFDRIRLEYEGLYPVLSMALVLLTFGGAESIRGNGFLAVYLCGVVLNQSNFIHKRYVVKFHDGLAWMMQISMFLVLGLLVFPSELIDIAPQGLLVAVFLLLVARPLAVALALVASEFSLRERALVAWTGLRGAVPVVLATFPLIAGYENSPLVFNIVFFTVLTSVLVQGTLLMPVARGLKVDEPLASRPAFSLEIQHRGQAQGETRELEILPNMAVVGRTVADLGIPPDVLILLIGRGEGFVVPRGQTRIEPYDTLLMLGSSHALRNAADVILSPPAPRHPELPTDPLATLPDEVAPAYVTGHAIIVGYGRVGRRIGETLRQRGIRIVVVDMKRDIVEQLRQEGVQAILGDAAVPLVMAQAHAMRAALLIIATPDTMKVRQIADAAQALNPNIQIIVRSHSEMEAALLTQEEIGTVILGEQALADSMARHALAQLQQAEPPPEEKRD